MKRCRDCGEWKSLNAFPLRRDSTDGHRNNCKACKSASAERYRLANAASERERKRRWAAANADRVRAKKRREYLANRELFIQRANARHKAKRDEILAQRRADYAADPSKRLEVNRVRQALTAGASAAELVHRAVVFERDAGRCGICGKSVDPKKWHLDHIVPLSRGGEHSYANVQVTHPRCNLVKSATPPVAAAA